MPGPIQPIAAPILPTAIRPAGAAKPGGFPEMLAGAIRDVESFRAGANASVERFLSGEGEELHTAALAVQRSELAFDLFLQARNKVVQAYQEIMRMQM
jgi:flagellar hook-basal body complex protein FliE